jgi:hypothetical protein
MKKFIILVLAGIFCLAFALPATAAEVKIGGSVCFEMYSYYEDEARRYAEVTGGGLPQGVVNPVADDRKTKLGVYGYGSGLTASWTNDEGTLGASMGWYYGYENTALWSDDANDGVGVDWRSHYFWWKPMPDVKLWFGRIGQVAFVGGPPDHGGQLDISGTAGYGDVPSWSRAGIKAYITINEMVELDIGMYDPDDNDDGRQELVVPTNVPGMASANEQNTIPRFDIALPIKYGNISVRPSGSWMIQEFDQVVPGSDDDFTIWAAVLHASYTYGPITLAGEYVTAENLSDGNYGGSPGPNAQQYVDAAGNNRFSDSEQDYWWLSAKWKINPKMDLAVWYGETSSENTDDPTNANDNWDISTSQFGVEFQYFITPAFKIHPSYILLDHGDDNLRGAGVLVDDGERSAIVASFTLSF